MTKLRITILIILFFTISCASKENSPDAQYDKTIQQCYLFAILTAGPSSPIPTRCEQDAARTKRKAKASDYNLYYY